MEWRADGRSEVTLYEICEGIGTSDNVVRHYVALFIKSVA